eukprot:1039854-Amphidinium_carterae.1
MDYTEHDPTNLRDNYLTSACKHHHHISTNHKAVQNDITNTVCTTEDDQNYVNNTTWIRATSALTVHYSTIYYTIQLCFSTSIYVTAMGRLHTREAGNDHTINQPSHLERKFTWKNSCQKTKNFTAETKSKSTKQSGLEETRRQ